jgi:hypothetical protein
MDVRITIETTFDNGEMHTHQLEGISRRLPMSAWESAEGCGGRPKGLTE